MDESAR